MSNLSLDDPVSQWVLERPGRTRLFERLGIDYCCGGRKSLAEACAAKGLDARTVVATLDALEAAQQPGAGAEQDWTRESLTVLCDHIEETHHRYLKDELPRLGALMRKVAASHGQQHPELLQIQQAFTAISKELLDHLPKEESILFPAIRQMEAGTLSRQALPFGSLANPIRMMMAEHEAAGQLLEEIRQRTQEYQCPGDACGSYRALYDGLRELEQNTHEHIHKENNILFPRAIALEEGSV